MMKTPSFKPARMKKCAPSAAALCENLDLKRATCSTTLKHCKSYAGRELNVTSGTKVCPYNYGSLNGHRHVPLPPLKCFLSARRCALKTQISIKMVYSSPRLLGGDPSFDEKLQGEHTDFFVEIYDSKKENAAENHGKKVVQMAQDGPFRYDSDSCDNLERTGGQNATEITEEVSPPSLAQEVDSESSDMDWDIGQNTPLYLDDDGYEHTTGMEKKQDIIHGDFIIKLGIPKDDVSQESFHEVSLKSEDTFSSSDDRESSRSYEVSLSNTKTSVPVLIPDEPEAAPDDENDFTKDQVLNQTSSGGGHQVQKRAMNHANKSQSEFSELTSAGNRCPTQVKVKPIKDSDKTGHFNPRGPNFLPVEPEPEAEKVDLRHREPHQRKNADEWMVDYALTQAVTKLAPFRKRKVVLLVEAFEKVMPAMRVQIHQRNSSA
ncbi:Calcium/calmodulin-dependent protein kinase [Handroanthus impetiginosus]|uniref:Calcium/calmodulin-dependent protein kinase n=1 Tax=Handroanthus impetiginosus TaxID=429701 RepID=A0A2G9GDQ8_9LAMI|nr:Calcium/calmodulin-dependent protein kinase [Handroanthus impetiginosus]